MKWFYWRQYFTQWIRNNLDLFTFVYVSFIKQVGSDEQLKNISSYGNINAKALETV